MPRALVTGASSGIGRAYAVELAAQGYDLVLVARDKARLEALAEQLRVDTQVLPADLATPDGVAAVAERIGATEAPIDLLVNNAGSGLYQSFGTAPLEDEQQMLALNVGAVLELTWAAVRVMRPRGHGQILNVASVAGLVPRPETVTYGAGKAYVIALTEGISSLLRGSGVQVTVVCPGFTRTEFHDRAQVDMSYLPGALWLSAEQVVRESLADLRGGRTISVPGRAWKVIAAAGRLAPRSVVRRLGASGRPTSRR